MQAIITTNRGAIRLELFPEQAPLTTANFVNLVRRGFYDGLRFHRVIEQFMIQGGCPEGSGRGNPGYRFEDEFSQELRHDRPGRLSMANAGLGTNGSQFFITHVATPWLDDRHTIFGTVQDDQDQAVVDAIRQGDTLEKVEIQGDAEALLQRFATRIGEWSKALDSRFPAR